MMEETLRVEKIVDFCDVPQLFVARDTFDTLYLCLLYEDMPVCRYTGVRISTNRLESFLSGDIDLRTIYQAPEKENEYFDIEYDEGKYLKRASKEQKLPEEKLPAEGYMLPKEIRENMLINLPIKDHGLLTELVRKFGWACM